MKNKINIKNIENGNNLKLKDEILRLIWREHRISRAEISRQLNLSRSTVTELVRELFHTGLITEVGVGKSSGGRKPILLEFQDNAKFILGIDIGARHVSVAVTNLRGQLVKWIEEKFPVREDFEGTMRLIEKLSQLCFDELQIDNEKLLSIGVAVPSPVDPKKPYYLSESILPAWHGRSGVMWLKEKFNVPVYMDNDANLGALAEHWFGVGRDYSDIIYIKIANGIGAGYILDGKLYRGSKGIAGEMSHMPIDPNGRLCGCGLRGCLATVASAWALIERVKVLAKLYPESPLLKINPQVKDIEDAALNRDPMAMQIIAEATNYLSAAIVSIVNLLNPELVIIGGSLSRLGEMILNPIRKRLHSVSLVKSVDFAKVDTGKLGPKSIAIGAAALAIEQAFSDPKLLRNNIQTAIIE